MEPEDNNSNVTTMGEQNAEDKQNKNGGGVAQRAQQAKNAANNVKNAASNVKKRQEIVKLKRLKQLSQNCQH